MKTLIYLVRHGESLGNAKRIYLGHTNLDLSDLGYIQANVTAQYLKGVKIDAIYSSDLLRAHNTALPHAQLRNLKVIDSTAASMCKDNNVKIHVFGIKEPHNMVRAICGEKIGTIIY